MQAGRKVNFIFYMFIFCRANVFFNVPLFATRNKLLYYVHYITKTYFAIHCVLAKCTIYRIISRPVLVNIRRVHHPAVHWRVTMYHYEKDSTKPDSAYNLFRFILCEMAKYCLIMQFKYQIRIHYVFFHLIFCYVQTHLKRTITLINNQSRNFQSQTDV